MRPKEGFCLVFVRWEKEYHVSRLMRKNPVKKGKLLMQEKTELLEPFS